MICPLDDQPCTGDHSQACARECARMKANPVQVMNEWPVPDSGTRKGYRRNGPDDTVAKTIKLGCATALCIIMIAVAITLSLLVLAVGRSLGG